MVKIIKILTFLIEKLPISRADIEREVTLVEKIILRGRALRVIEREVSLAKKINLWDGALLAAGPAVNRQPGFRRGDS